MNNLATTLPTRLLFLCAVFTIGFMTAAIAQDEKISDIDWKKGVWSELTPYLGTYNYEKILKNAKVKPEINALLKGTDIDLAKQFEVTSPIGLENDCLILQGNPAHSGDTNGIYMDICISSGSVHIAFFKDGKTTVYSKQQQFQYLPNGLRTWAYLQSDDKIDLTIKPQNTQIMVQAN